MARLYHNGFELNSTTSDVEGDTYSSVTVSSTQARTGTYGLRANAVASAPFWRTQILSADSSTAICYFRFYLYIASSTNALVQIARVVNLSNVQQLTIRLNTDNTLQLTNNSVTQVGSSSSALSTGTWYRVEVSFNPVTGAIEAKLNGTAFASGSSAAGSWAQVLLGAINGTPTCDLYFDDIAINDDSGSFQNSYPGDGKLLYLKPNAAGDANSFASQTGGTAGSANNYTRVSEVTPDDATSFNGSSTLNEEDFFNIENGGLGAGDTINVVTVGARFRNSTADATAAFKLEIKKTVSGTISQSAAIVPNSTTWRTNTLNRPRNYPLTLYQDPDSSNWTNSTIDSAQIGYKLTTAPGTAGRRIDVSKVWLVVDYTPGAAPSTQIKTLAGVAKASVKTASGVAIASVKKVAGVTN